MVTMIWAQDLAGVIGVDGDLPWHIPADLSFFKKTTTGQTIIMGRATWESLPVKPLPGRFNVVVSSNKERFFKESVRVDSVVEAVEKYPNAIVIGGGSVYEQALPYADTLYMTRVRTHIDTSNATDVAFAPDNEIIREEFEIVNRSALMTDEATGLKFEFLHLVRKDI